MSTTTAIATDLGPLLLFAVQHSVMARRGFKTRLRVPAVLERSVYVIATDLVIALLLAGWQPFGDLVWHVDEPTSNGLWLLFAAGWVLAIAATFSVDHYELVGLRQAGWLNRSSTPPAGGLQVSGLHAFVRHPLLTCLLVAVWATPHLGASHLLFALGASSYIWIGTRFEERDLRHTFGPAYDDYAPASRRSSRASPPGDSLASPKIHPPTSRNTLKASCFRLQRAVSGSPDKTRLNPTDQPALRVLRSHD